MKIITKLFFITAAFLLASCNSNHIDICSAKNDCSDRYRTETLNLPSGYRVDSVICDYPKHTIIIKLGQYSIDKGNINEKGDLYIPVYITK